MPISNDNTLVKIAMADDHAMFRETLCTVIDGWENCKVIIRAANGKQLLEKINPKNLPDIVLTDLQMPEMNGYETIKDINKKYPAIKIMVISQYQSEEMIWQLIKCGAHGFVSKNDDTPRLKKAMEELLRNGYFFTDHAASRMLKKAMQTGQMVIQNDLSEEELAFLKYISTKKPYKEIACKMSIEERHAEYIRNNLFERFGVNTRTELAITAIQKGLSI
ncbi:MAG TPA: response regulator transcription factor [Chitinophagaceae bacterium]|nr:response regulator transcription factor [Chitinophagaceae bacterium]